MPTRLSSNDSSACSHMVICDHRLWERGYRKDVMDIHFPKSRKSGKVVVWEKDPPLPGEYKIPPSDDVPMPVRYRDQGYVRKELDYWGHRGFCKRHGLANHAMEDVRNDGDVLGNNRWGY